MATVLVTNQISMVTPSSRRLRQRAHSDACGPPGEVAALIS